MSYTIDNIETLEFRDAVRKRISMYLGSNDMNGVYNAIQEIISNSIDEYYMGFGKEITLSLGYNKEKEPIITIEDKGRGVPFGSRKNGDNVLVDIYSKSHTGGKFDDKVYNSVAGLNGVGAKATALSSSYFEVASCRDGKVATAVFKKGILEDYQEKPCNNPTGTKISFTPDQEVYNLEPIKVDFQVLKDKIKNLSYLTKGLRFKLTHSKLDGTTEEVEYFAKNGLVDLVREHATNPIHHTPIQFEIQDGQTTLEVVLQWTKGREEWFVFTNGIQNIEGGTPLTGMRTAITRFVKRELGEKMEGELARKGLVYAVFSKVPNPSFANQTKTKISNPELNGLAQRATGEALNGFAFQRPGELHAVLEYLEKEKKAEAAAERARQAVLTQVKEIRDAQKKKVFDVDKLSDAEYLGKDATLLLVEGNSAGSAMAVSRDTKNFGILRLRGKIKNLLSCPIEEGLENEEVKLFLKATGIDIQNYRNSKLRYGSVAICVDADDDGAHIACLIMALLQRLAPEFIKEGRLKWLRAPLYKVTKGKDVHYFYTTDELEKSRIKGTQVRFKGLGEMRGEDAKVMFGPQQRLETLEWSKEGEDLLLDLMGSEVQPRKDFVFNYINFEEYGDI